MFDCAGYVFGSSLVARIEGKKKGGKKEWGCICRLGFGVWREAGAGAAT